MPDKPDQPRVRFGGAEAIRLILFILLGLVLLADLGVSSFMCGDNQGSNLACALGVIGGHVVVYLAAIGVIALIVYVLRRVTR